VVLVAPQVFSQETSEEKPPVYRGVTTHVPGVFVTPIPGSPLTAVVKVESTQVLADGSTVTKKTIEKIARDSQGRVYNERRQLMPPSFTGTPALISFHLYDPVTKLNTFLEPATHLARQSTWTGGEANMEKRGDLPNGARNPLIVEEDLGTQTMEGIWVHGMRRTRTVPANTSGTGKAVLITDEYWYSEELHLNLLVKHDDPRTGQQIVEVSQVDRKEPDQAMFNVPAGYKVVDENPEN
jgi:hypothetical protein